MFKIIIIKIKSFIMNKTVIHTYVLWLVKRYHVPIHFSLVTN